MSVVIIIILSTLLVSSLYLNYRQYLIGGKFFERLERNAEYIDQCVAAIDAVLSKPAIIGSRDAIVLYENAAKVRNSVLSIYDEEYDAVRETAYRQAESAINQIKEVE